MAGSLGEIIVWWRMVCAALGFGMVVGDILWPFLAIMGLAALTAQFDALLPLLKWFACGMFLYTGLQVVLKADKPIRTNSRLTKSGH